MDNAIWSLYEDRAGILWVGTNSGFSKLNRTDRSHEKYEHYRYNFLNPNSPQGFQIRVIFEDHLGLLWIGTLGDGLFSVNWGTGKVIQYQHDPEDPNSLGDNNIYSIHEDKSGVLWIGTNGSGLERFERENEKFSQHHYTELKESFLISTRWTITIFESQVTKDNVLWLGSWSCGLNKFNKKTEEFTSYLPDPVNPNSISNIIFSICEDQNGNLWLGTNGGGLLNFNVQEEKFTRYSGKDGLPNNVICGILEDNYGCLWLSTNKGLSRFNPQTATFTNYDLTDGIQSNEFNLGAYYKSKSGEMFFGGAKGFNSFYPDDIINSLPPCLVVTTISLYGNKVTLPKPITKVKFSYRDDYISFGFVALHFKDPGKNQYAYKLEGFDKEWIYSGAKREALYTNIDPGRYLFKVKAANCDGVWNETGVSVEVIITAPFWQTWWFYLISFSLLGTIIVSIIKFRISQALKIERAKFSEREQIRENLAADFHDGIGSRATKISMTCQNLKNELKSIPPRISKYLDNIIANADCLFKEREDHIWVANPARDSLLDLAVYLKDFSDQLFDDTDIAFQLVGLRTDFETIKLPMEWRQHLLRIFQEGMNNILRHAEGCKNVSLKMSLQNSNLEILLSDDGKGFDVDNCLMGNGLKNMRKRAQKILGKLQIISKKGVGTKIHFIAKLPERTVDFN